ncbi:MAG: serine hydrolase domain-containing protein [Pseudomonadota bacterium]
MTMRVLLVLILMWVPSLSAAQDADRMKALRMAYAEWLVRRDITGTGALAFQGVLTTHFGDASAPAELASVSKSITALCAAALSDLGQLEFSDSVRDVLGRGPDVSIASLVTHTSGITMDITQALMPLWVNSDVHRADLVLGLIQDPVGDAGTFSYNNVNYALLGLVIEARATGDYESTCRRLVLNPAGARGQPSPVSGSFLSWGGWSMSASDYARVHSHWFGSATNTGRNPLDYPHVKPDGFGWYYGLGTAFRENHTGDGTYNFWHFGSLCMPGLLNIGAYAVTWGAKWTAVLAYDACVNDDDRLALDSVMGRAAYGPLE